MEFSSPGRKSRLRLRSRGVLTGIQTVTYCIHVSPVTEPTFDWTGLAHLRAIEILGDR